MMRLTCAIAAAALLILGLSGPAEATSLKAGPASFILHNVTPGKLYDVYAMTGLRLTITNDDDESETWVLSTHRPSEGGHWEKGYGEIPDPKWCLFDRTEITVPPKTDGNVNFFLKIPDDEQYYNQHWIVTLNISGKPVKGTSVALAVNIRGQIETESKADVKARPAGALGMRPSLVEFERMTPGGTAEAQVELYNNSPGDRTYTLSSLLADSTVDRTVYFTEGYSQIPDAAWITHENTVAIKQGQSAVIRLGLRVPDDPANLGKKWEELLLITPDDGLPEFVRIQVQTAEGPKKS